MKALFDLISNFINSADPLWMIGQILGIVAIILGFISYQVRTQRQLLLMQTLVAVVFGAHYFLIGAYSGMAMNLVNIFRNAAYDYRERKGVRSRLIPLSFVAIQVFICALTWEAWYSVFVLLGIGINTYCMSFSDPQNVRKSILITSPLVLTYDIFAHSIGGSVYESVSIVSAFIGILRSPKEQKN